MARAWAAVSIGAAGGGGGGVGTAAAVGAMRGPGTAAELLDDLELDTAPAEVRRLLANKSSSDDCEDTGCMAARRRMAPAQPTPCAREETADLGCP